MDGPITVLQTLDCDWSVRKYIEVNFSKLTDNNQIFKNYFHCIHYHLCKISQIVECNEINSLPWNELLSLPTLWCHHVRVALDKGATANMIRHSIAHSLNSVITKTKLCANQADGLSPLLVVGEVCWILSRWVWFLFWCICWEFGCRVNNRRRYI